MATPKNILLYLWQLPQHVLALLVICATHAKPTVKQHLKYYETRFNIGVSLGNYIILHPSPSLNDLRHEYGHTRQSRLLGPLYLPVVGIPSLLRNLYDRLFHRHWSPSRSAKWYYTSFPESWADNLAHIHRHS